MESTNLKKIFKVNRSNEVPHLLAEPSWCLAKSFLRKRTVSTTNQDLRDKDSSNFRTPNNFKYPLFFSSKIAEPKEIKGKRRWIVLVKQEKERRKLLN